MDDETQEILNDFLTETTEMIDGLDQKFVELETQPDNKDLLNEIFRAMHSMKGSAGFLGFNHLVDVTHRAESILNKLRQGEMAVVPEIITVILETVDTVKAIMTEIRTSGTDVKIPVETMSLKLDDILAGKVSQPAAAASAPAAPIVAGAQESVKPVSAPPPQLGEILVNEGLATKEQVFDALTAQSKQPEPKQALGELLVAAKAISEKALDQALQKQEKAPKAEEDATIRVETRPRLRDESRRRIGARPQSPDQNRRTTGTNP